MRIPINVKEMHQVTGFLVTLSRFLSCVNDKAFLFFSSLKKKKIFEYTVLLECEEAFSKVKTFQTSSTILIRLREDLSLLLYLSDINQVMSSVLVPKIDKVEKPVYLVSIVSALSS